MKLLSHFADFLTDTVDLNQTRIDQLEYSITALKTFIDGSNWQPRIRSWASHGSWAHKTIIKPLKDQPYDADLVVFVRPCDDWSAADYIQTLYETFRENGTYRSMVTRSSHCVTIHYTGDKKIDIAPCIKDRNDFAGYEVCNRNTDAFERSDPPAYTQWMIVRNGWSTNNSFRKVTRLLKYLRDIKTRFTCPSVLLTTLIGMQIKEADKNGDEFSDTPTSLKTIVGRLDDWLQKQNTIPTVYNPVLQTEVFSGVWDETKFNAFRDSIHRYRGWIDDAYNEPNKNESIGKWRKLFGDEFAASVDKEESRSITARATEFLTENLERPSIAGDYVDLFLRFGARLLAPLITTLPHIKRPKWKRAPHTLFKVHIRADLYSSRGGKFIKAVQPNTAVPKLHSLRFIPVSSAPISDRDFYVKWRITNTGPDAVEADALRGGFESPNEGALARWEPLSFRGVHMAELFIIRRRDNQIVGECEPFYVIIE